MNHKIIVYNDLVGLVVLLKYNIFLISEICERHAIIKYIGDYVNANFDIDKYAKM